MKDIVEKNSTFAFVSNLGVILFIFRRPFLKMAASGQENENFGWSNIQFSQQNSYLRMFKI